MKKPLAHSVNFARTLALATTLALPACGGEDIAAPSARGEPAPTTAPVTAPAPGAGTALAQPSQREAAFASSTRASTTSSEDAGGGDAAAPHSGHLSGPLPPPELPASLA